ncbi:MAG: tRNA modification GTPase [Phycisphaerales bacterium]|jgi:tRNA modification GTPase|nr:tRNA modification GTPase [Phycisphaerales bacterium]
MNNDDTIYAISSAAGASARMIVRLCGPGARAVATSVCPDLPDVAGAKRLWLRFADLEVRAWVYLFVSPRSYTGDDLVEFHLPGNVMLVQLLIGHLRRQDVRMAEPGEFTARAYFNGRMDLTEAEGVSAVISAHSERELNAARQLLAGELAARLRPMMDQLTEALALIEAEIDFVDEPVTFLARPDLRGRLESIRGDLQNLLVGSRRFERLSHQPRVVLVGRPNAGKSTLLNWLAGHDRAIVSPLAGTTRDVLWAEVMLPAGVIHLVDVAGLEVDEHAVGVVDAQMQDHARRAIAEADLAVLVREVNDSRPMITADRAFDLHVFTKADLLNGPGGFGEDAILVSAKTGMGREYLIQAINRLVFTRDSGEARLALNQRHVQAIELALDHVQQAASMAESAAIELLALELRTALNHLGGILGMVSPDDLLGEIFSRFCIGK